MNLGPAATNEELKGRGKSPFWWFCGIVLAVIGVSTSLLVGGWYYTISINPTRPQLFPEKNFDVVTSRLLYMPGGFYEGDMQFSRIDTNLPPKAAMQAIISCVKSDPNPTHLTGPRKFSAGHRVGLEKTLSVLRYPPVAPPPTTPGWTIGYRHDSVCYTYMYLWPKPGGGTIIDLVEGGSL
jgi:hypothetical protein